MVESPAHDYVATTKIDSYGGGFGTGYDSADIYVNRLSGNGDDISILSIEDNNDDLSTENIKIIWLSSKQIRIEFGHGNITFQAIKFSDISIFTTQNKTLDVARP